MMNGQSQSGQPELESIVSDNNATKKPIDNANDIDTVTRHLMALIFAVERFVIPQMKEASNRIVTLEQVVGVNQTPPEAPMPTAQPMPTQPPVPPMGV
jgi:hypothetical protein